MKKVLKRTLIIIVSVFVLFLGVGLIYYLPMLMMPRPEAGQIPNTNIYALKDMAGVFLVKTDNGYLMIDAGLNIKNIDSSLKEANINANDVKWIFLTHSDGDHVAALALFPNANIYMSKEELQLINGTVKRSFLGYTNLPEGIKIERIISVLNDQELSFNGTKVKCILAPGHTIGSMVYLVDDKYLFTGDAFKLKNGNMSVHPYSMDKNLSTSTIGQLRDTVNNSQVVITSHYGKLHNN